MEELLTRYGKVDYAWFDGFNWPGAKLDYKLDGKTMTFTIPKDKTTPLLDVIKLEWQ